MRERGKGRKRERVCACVGVGGACLSVTVICSDCIGLIWGGTIVAEKAGKRNSCLSVHRFEKPEVVVIKEASQKEIF